MKTSNIIITAFAILIVGAVFFLFADSEKHKEEEKNKISYKEYVLPSFKVIVAEAGSDIHIDRSDSTLMKIEYIKGMKYSSKLYEVTKDTLHVYSGLRMFIKCKQISQIVGTNHLWINVSHFEPDSLAVKLNGGRFIYNSDNAKKYTVNQKKFNITIIAIGSAFVELNNSKFGNLTIKSNNAFVNNYCETKSLNAKLTHGARLYSKDKNGVVAIEKDTASSVFIDDNNYSANR